MNKAEEMLQQFCDGYKKRDLPFLLNLFTQESNVWGTGVDEYRVGLAALETQFQRDWSQSEQAEIEIVRFIPVPDNALWAAAVCNAKITIGEVTHLEEHLRGTLHVKQVNGVWKIVHMHCSFPDYRNAENASFPVGS